MQQGIQTDKTILNTARDAINFHLLFPPKARAEVSCPGGGYEAHESAYGLAKSDTFGR